MKTKMLLLDDVVIGERVRKNKGDISGLARSINDLGLLQPIAVDPDNKLIAGERRLLAYKLLDEHHPGNGWDRIPAMVIRTGGKPSEIVADTEHLSETDEEDLKRYFDVRSEDRLNVVSKHLAKFDKGNGKCVACGYSFNVQKHHVIPLSKDGPDDDRNIIELCPNHHAGVHTLMRDTKNIDIIYKRVDFYHSDGDSDPDLLEFYISCLLPIFQGEIFLESEA